jgi:multidrug resistance efflux pump
MSLPPPLAAVARLPGRLLRGVGAGLRGVGKFVRGTLRSARFWALLILSLVGLLVAYYALSTRYTPFTNDAYVQAYVVQVAPRVSGQVVHVYVGENEHVEKGTPLFEIDPRPFAHEVRRLEAAVAQAVQQVAQLEAELTAARAEQARLAAEDVYARAVHEQEEQIYKKNSTTERRYLDAVQKFKASKAQVEKARAVVRQKEDALAARLGDEHALVAEVRARLATARLDLEWTRVVAPVSGYVTDLQLREGAWAAAGKPVLTCIDAGGWWVVANFRENSLELVRPGQRAAVSFKAYPGRIFPAAVLTVGRGVERGQGVPSGELPAVRTPSAWLPPAQRFQVRVVLDRPGDVSLPVGATASVTVYTTEDSPLNPVADWWQRLEAWFFYLR